MIYWHFCTSISKHVCTVCTMNSVKITNVALIKHVPVKPKSDSLGVYFGNRDNRKLWASHGKACNKSYHYELNCKSCLAFKSLTYEGNGFSPLIGFFWQWAKFWITRHNKFSFNLIGCNRQQPAELFAIGWNINVGDWLLRWVWGLWGLWKSHSFRPLFFSTETISTESEHIKVTLLLTFFFNFNVT